MENNRRNSIIFATAVALLTAVGLCLRIAFAWNSQLTHDELSAITRLGFDSFHDLILYGVYPDGHPAGVQVMMWEWAKAFGTSEFALRLPFVLMGTASIPIIYLVGKMWGSRGGGLFAAAAMAVSQYAIYYTSIARPYGAGLFTMTSMLYFWSRLVVEKNEKPNKWVDAVGFGIFAALCAYTHQFAMMEAGLTAIAGLILINKDYRKQYLAGCGLAIALWLPHLPITWHQMAELGGVGGWLGKPRWDFGIDYVAYLLNFSWILLLATILMIAICFSFKKAAFSEKKILIITASTLWLLPMLIGYCYSVWIDPVLQYSCLIFSWPFLLLLIATLFKKELSRLGILVGILWLLIMGITMNIFQDQKLDQVFETSFKKAVEEVEKYGDEQVLCWLGIDSSKLAYYESRYGKFANDHIDGYTLRDLDSIASRPELKEVVTAETDLYTLEVLKRHFNSEAFREDLQRSSVLVLCKGLDDIYQPRPLLEKGIEDFEPEQEFTPLLETTMKEIYDNRFEIVKAVVDFSADPLCEGEMPMLVMETLLGDQKIDYQCEPLDKMPWVGEGMIIRDLAEIAKSNYFLGHYKVKIYIWNPSHSNRCKPTKFQLYTEDGNQYRLSATEPTR